MSNAEIGERLATAAKDEISEFIEFHDNHNPVGLGHQPPNPGPPLIMGFNPLTEEVIEATVECLVQVAEVCYQCKVDSKTTESSILEEFNRCLVTIIDWTLKTNK